MKKISVKLGAGGYEIFVGSGLLASAGRLIKDLGFRDKAVVITNPVVRDLYGEKLQSSLTGAGLNVAVLDVPDGEEQKSLKMAGRLYGQLSRFRAERSTPVLALGGGVIGDLAGFVAATYMRGLPLVQVPTTLLAQVDSSIGGKVAVNHGRLKNVIGSFYQPGLVISDIQTLKTLPAAQVRDGLAEVIKYGVIRDKGLFALVEGKIEQIKKLDEELLEEIVFRSARIKTEVVEKDEKDLGLRNILNFGHTVGHAIEALSDFKTAHGSAVALGMIAAGRISNKLGYFKTEDLEKLIGVIERAGLPVKMPQFDIRKIMQTMTHDKKVLLGKVRFVLPKAIGNVFVTDEVSSTLVEEELRGLQ
ncbi:MAG: 3-dehydroquinate synthase [Dehalococcoidia bacterium]|nr:3-dehydroquinate synthase [Dehalococcoidia bacterium]